MRHSAEPPLPPASAQYFRSRRSVFTIIAGVLALWLLAMVLAGGLSLPPARGSQFPGGLVIAPIYGHGTQATWWIRSQAPELVLLVGTQLNGNEGCYMALTNSSDNAPQVYVYNTSTGDWLGDGVLCSAHVDGVTRDDGGGVLLRVKFADPAQWSGVRQWLWVLERGEGVKTSQWVRAAVWEISADPYGILWAPGVPLGGWGW